jgi:release factor glutamine methyltransferase
MIDNTREWTISATRRQLAEVFRNSGIESPELDARVLIGHALGLDHTRLVASAACALSAEEIDAINALAKRRLEREPVARIVGCKEFWSLPLRISAATLVPRPETETVVEAALAIVDAKSLRAQPLRIADLGTGTGAILLALLSELPKATGIGTDISSLALDTARANARSLGLDGRSEFLLSDFCKPLDESFDIVVSNPPYIATPELRGLPSEVRDHDPRLALDGGHDGLTSYRRIAGAAAGLLKPCGSIVVEIGAGQAVAVSEIFAAAGLQEVAPRTDLAGLPRALAFRMVS